MTEYHSVTVKLSDFQLDKIKSVAKSATGVTLRLSSDIFIIIYHCMKIVQIRSFSWSVFFRIQTEYGKIFRIHAVINDE